MSNRAKVPRLNPALILGFAMLAVANLFLYLTKMLPLSGDVADPLNGFMFGTAIGAMLLGLVKQARLKRARRR